jgi:hypothetical protein
MEQLFQLSGENFDLEDLADLFSTGAATVKKIEDRYYMQLPEWESPSRAKRYSRGEDGGSYEAIPFSARRQG